MKRFFIILIAVFVCLFIIIQCLIANLLKRPIIKELKKIVNTEIEIDDLGVNLVKGVVSFSGFRVKNSDGFKEKYFLIIKNGYVDIDLPALLFRKIVIQKIFLENPCVNIVINNIAISNTTLIFKKQDAVKKESVSTNHIQREKTSFIINRINIEDGVFKLVNYNVNTEGAAALFDKIDILIKNLTKKYTVSSMPTSIIGTARLPAKEYIGNMEFNIRGAFLTGQIDFDLDLKATDISLPYFMPFYIKDASVLAKTGHFNLISQARCRSNQLSAMQKVSVKDLALILNPINIKDNLVFGLPIETFVNFFINSRGSLDFDFGISGTLSDPKFYIQEALKKVLVKSIGDTIMNELSKIPSAIIERAKETKDLEKAGKEVLKDIFQKILGPTNEQR